MTCPSRRSDVPRLYNFMESCAVVSNKRPWAAQSLLAIGRSKHIATPGEKLKPLHSSSACASLYRAAASASYVPTLTTTNAKCRKAATLVGASHFVNQVHLEGTSRNPCRAMHKMSSQRVAAMRQPDAPMGWPMAIAWGHQS